MEYPQARCICDSGYYGIDCIGLRCENNCSYPNGVCDNGVCKCAYIRNPYNSSLVWKKWEGPDCSYCIYILYLLI